MDPNIWQVIGWVVALLAGTGVARWVLYRKVVQAARAAQETYQVWEAADRLSSVALSETAPASKTHQAARAYAREREEALAAFQAVFASRRADLVSAPEPDPQPRRR